MPPRSPGFAPRSWPGRAKRRLQCLVLEPPVTADISSPVRAWDSACDPTEMRWRWPHDLLWADVFALHECDNMRRMARVRRGGGRPTIRVLGREARRPRSVALRQC